MNVGELRKRLAAFDDDVEVLAAPKIRMKLAGEGREIDVPHPQFQREIASLHVVGNLEQGRVEVSERYVVLAYSQAEVPEGEEGTLSGEKCKGSKGAAVVYFLEQAAGRTGDA